MNCAQTEGRKSFESLKYRKNDALYRPHIRFEVLLENFHCPVKHQIRSVAHWVAHRAVILQSRGSPLDMGESSIYHLLLTLSPFSSFRGR